MAVIGLDVGTTGCKCTIFDIKGCVSAFSYMEYDIINPDQGHFELNPNEVWDAVKYVIASAVREYNGEKVEALCISSFGEAAIPVSKNGDVLHNSLLYTDPRGASQMQKLESTLGLQNIMNLTGLHAHPMFSINKIMWIKENLPKVYKETWKFMLFGDFILYKLGGIPVIDYSLASRTMAFNVTSLTWDETVLNAAGVEKDIFSPTAASGTIIGTISKNVAAELGLPLDVKLVTGGHDQACAAVGGGIINEGKAIDGIGTVECITPAFNQPLFNMRMLNNNYACVPHVCKRMYITYAFNFTGGSLLKWFRDNFAAELKLKAEKTGKSIYSLLDASAPTEPTNILILPHFAGAGTPYMDTESRGAIVGLSFDTTREQIYRASLEGVTYEMLYNMQCLSDAGIDIKELRAVGGGAKSDLWLQIKADILDKKISALNVGEAGTLGTAIIAGTAIGAYSSLENAVDTLVSVKKEFYPNKKTNERYMENYARYKKMYRLVKEMIN